MNRKGFSLIVVLSIITVLSLFGFATIYFITRETRSSVSTENSLQALKAAESGVEVALTKIKKGEVSNYPFSLTGNIGTATFSVIINTDSNHNYILITSLGIVKDAERKVEVAVKKLGISYYPFAVNGKFNINKFSNTGSGEWTDAILATKEISEDLKKELEEENFTVLIKDDLKLPQVSELNTSNFFPSEDKCDYGNYDSDLTIDTDLTEKKGFEDKNGDGEVIICGNNITLDNSLIYFNNNLKIVAQNNIYFTDNTTLKKEVGSTTNLSLIAGNQMIFDRNSNIDFSGADAGYNILLYAKEGIESSDTTGQWLSISGNQNTENTSNVFILTEGKLEVNRDIIDDTATTKQDVNFIVWADKGILSTNGGFDVSGSSKTVRNFAVLVPEGDAIFDHWQFSGSEKRSGLTYDDIKNYCNDTSIPYFFRDIYCQLEKLIKNGGSTELKIEYWKVY